MPDCDAELAAEEKQYPLAPSLLDVAVYRSPSRYQQELDHVLLRGWFPVAPSGDVANARDSLVGSGNCRRGNFICPWHGSAYNLDGKVTNVPLRPSFNPSERNLDAVAPRSFEMLGAKPMEWKLT